MAAAAAAGAGPAAGDSTLTWAFERLVDCPEVPVHVLTDMLLPVVATGLADLPDCTRARLCLRLVDSDLRESRVDETTLEYLRELAACDVAPHADPALVRPTPELMLQVKTAAALEAFSLPSPDNEDLLNKVFTGEQAGVQLTVEEWARYQELLGALHNPAAAPALRARYPIQATAVQLSDFVHTASSSLPCLLLTVQADIAAGRYVPGAMPQPAAPAAQPRRNLLASPGRVAPPRPPPEVPAAAVQQPPGAAAAAAAAAAEEYDFPSMDEGYVSAAEQPAAEQPAAEQPVAEQQEVVRQLHNSLDNLQKQGGQDPLHQSLVDANEAAQQAGPAAAAGPRVGRARHWEDSPVAGPPPQLPRVEAHQHSPLPPQSARRQAGQAPVAVAHSGGGAARRTENGRRKPKRWESAEEAALVRLVKKHGRGNWALILKDGVESGEIDKDRKQGDMKDKWRNLIKQNRIQAHEIIEIEARETELRQEPRRGPGRPPKFASPGGAVVRKRRRDANLLEEDEEEEEEEQEMEDAVENADEEEAAEAAEAAEEEDEEEDEGEAAEEAAEEAVDIQSKRRKPSRRKPSKNEPQRRQTRSQDAGQAAERGGRGRGRARG